LKTARMFDAALERDPSGTIAADERQCVAIDPRDHVSVDVSQSVTTLRDRDEFVRHGSGDDGSGDAIRNCEDGVRSGVSNPE
jgi:hypothetical protein